MSVTGSGCVIAPFYGDDLLSTITCTAVAVAAEHCGSFVAPQPQFHDFHHERGGGAPGCGIYGLLGWLDALHGTDMCWRAECAAVAKVADAVSS